MKFQSLGLELVHDDWKALSPIDPLSPVLNQVAYPSWGHHVVSTFSTEIVPGWNTVPWQKLDVRSHLQRQHGVCPEEDGQARLWQFSLYPLVICCDLMGYDYRLWHTITNYIYINIYIVMHCIVFTQYNQHEETNLIGYDGNIDTVSLWFYQTLPCLTTRSPYQLSQSAQLHGLCWVGTTFLMLGIWYVYYI